jgi:hypothetical protein
MRHVKLLGLSLLFLASSAGAEGGGWRLEPAQGTRGAVLSFAQGEPVSYRFECAADAVIVTETGVTGLLDPATGGRIGDGADAVMPAGAAVMALFSGEGEPRFTPGEAARNAAGGWDISIRLARDDEQLQGIAKSEMISLFTTGYTMAVKMDGEARAAWKRFLKSCAAPR